MSKNLIDEVREMLPYFYNGTAWNENPTIMFEGQRIENKEIIYFIENITRLFVASDFLNESTKYWITCNAKSVKQAVDIYNSQRVSVDQLNFNTVKSKIQYDKKRVEKIFGNDLIYNVKVYPEKYLDEACEKLVKLERKYIRDKEYSDATVLKIDKTVVNRTLSEDDFNELLNILSTYSKKKIENVCDLSTGEMNYKRSGYFNYLISSRKLPEKDEERKKLIRKALGLSDSEEN